MGEAVDSMRNKDRGYIYHNVELLSSLSDIVTLPTTLRNPLYQHPTHLRLLSGATKTVDNKQ